MIVRLRGRAAVNRWAGICEQQAGVAPEFDAIEAGEAQLLAQVREEGRIAAVATIAGLVKANEEYRP